MKTLWGEMTKKGLIQLIGLGAVMIAATATATYWVTDRANHKAPAQAVGFVPGAASVSGAGLNPAQGQPGVLYLYNPDQGFVPVYLEVQGVVPQMASPNGLTQGNSQALTLPYQAANPVPEATQKEVVKEKVVRVGHVHRTAARPSGSRQEGGVLGGLSKTTKGALIGGVLGATGGALIGGRGKHKTANGALTGAAIGTVTGGILGHAMENK